MLDSIKNLFGLLPAKDRVKFAILVGLMFIGTVLELIGIGLIPLFVSAVADPDLLFHNQHTGPFLESMGIETARQLLVSGGVLLIAVFLVRSIYLVVLNFFKAGYIYGRFESFATELYKSYLYSPYTFHLNRNSAELVRNVTNEARYVAEFVLQPFLTILMHGITAAGIFILLLLIEPLITLLTFIILGGGGALILKFQKNRMNKHGEIASFERSRLIQSVNEGLGGIKDVLLMNRQHHLLRQFRMFASNIKKAETFKTVSDQAVKPVMEFMAVGGMMLIALTMVFQGRPIATIIPVLTLFGVAAVRLMPAISQIISRTTLLRFYAYSLKPVHKDITQQRSVEENEKIQTGLDDQLRFTKEIKLAEITYQYPNSREIVLSGIHLTIKKGEAIGFVGPSGAGKSTIVDVILGLLEPQKGNILVDGTDIATQMRSWQNNLGYIPQFIFLSDDTVRNNIAFGIAEDEISNEKIRSAIEAAQLKEFIETLPEGLDTVIGERGVRLSGGQRQRIGIARALYNNPGVLIMDEATSALDNETEKQVIDAIEQLKGERTIIMIAHRLTTVMNCDRLYLLEDGKIIGHGTYNELIGSSEKFKKLAMEEG